MSHYKRDQVTDSAEPGLEGALPDLREALPDKGHVRLGSLLAQIGRALGGVTLDIERDKTPARILSLD